MKRFLMKTDLSKWIGHQELGVRKILISDARALGEVMYEAYVGTIDYSGETVAEACSEVEETLNGKYGMIIEDACLLTEENNQIVSAVIFNWFKDEQMPLLTFSMTRAEFKGKGHAKKLLRAGLAALSNTGHSHCCLYVTEGNEPAISIYKSLDFEVKKNI